MRRTGQVVVLVLCGAVGCGRARPRPQAEPPRPLSTFEVVDNATPGVVVGKVMTASGEPLADALISSLDRKRMVSTKDDGRFFLSGLPLGVDTLLIRGLGYVEARVPVAVRADAGTAVTVHMAQETLRLCCICPGVVVPAIAVRVWPDPQHDLRLPVIPGVVVEVQRQDSVGRFVLDSLAFNPRDSIREVRAFDEMSGKYSVEVTAPGYANWYRPGLRVTRVECGVTTQTLDVYLRRLP